MRCAPFLTILKKTDEQQLTMDTESKKHLLHRSNWVNWVISAYLYSSTSFLQIDSEICGKQNWKYRGRMWIGRGVGKILSFPRSRSYRRVGEDFIVSFKSWSMFWILLSWWDCQLSRTMQWKDPYQSFASYFRHQEGGCARRLQNLYFLNRKQFGIQQ